MKKLFEIMIMTGLMLAVVTAGGADSNSISTVRIISQSTLASLLMILGTCFMLGGERA